MVIITNSVMHLNFVLISDGAQFKRAIKLICSTGF